MLIKYLGALHNHIRIQVMIFKDETIDEVVCNHNKLKEIRRYNSLVGQNIYGCKNIQNVERRGMVKERR